MAAARSLLDPGRAALRIGHRGAPAIAPENTILGFRAAVEAGVDVVEFDVLDLTDGSLVVTHSSDLSEVSHGTVQGTIDGLDLAAVRRHAPDLPTLAEALTFFVDEAPAVGLLVDLKLRGGPERAIRELLEHEVAARTIVSSPRPDDIVHARAASGALLVTLTYPEDRRGISTRPGMAPVVRTGLLALKRLAPYRVPALAAALGAHGVSLHKGVVSRALVSRLHARGLGAIGWTAQTRKDVVALRRAGVDAIVTDDPRLLSVED